MAFATIQYFSRSLQKASSVNVIFPDCRAIHDAPWSTFYLLHGLSDDHTIWMRRTSIERYVAGLPLMVVMPDGGRGWYTNAQDGMAYEDDLLVDIRGLIERVFPVRAERSGRAIGGLSMGGFGAVKNALKHPDLFSSVTSHSGALGVAKDPESGLRIGSDFTRVFGKTPEGGTEDPFALLESADRHQMPAFWIDCGVEDFLLDQNRAFHASLVKKQIEHEYHEFPGDHDWTYWDCHIQDAIAFHARNLQLSC